MNRVLFVFCYALELWCLGRCIPPMPWRIFSQFYVACLLRRLRATMSQRVPFARGIGRWCLLKPVRCDKVWSCRCHSIARLSWRQQGNWIRVVVNRHTIISHHWISLGLDYIYRYYFLNNCWRSLMPCIVFLGDSLHIWWSAWLSASRQWPNTQ